MKFFFIVFFLSLNVVASDCISQASNLTLGHKLKLIIGSEYYGDDESKDVSVDFCKTSKDKADWEDSKNSKVKIIKIIKNDFKTKGKTSSEFLYDLDETPGKKEVTDSEICPLVDKQIKKDSNCPSEASLFKSLSGMNFLSMDFEQACRAILPKVKENYKSRGTCFEDVAKKVEVVKREAPGEEIAPADDGTPVVRTQVLKPKTREEVKAEQPAQIRSGSGVSRQ